MKHGIVVSVMLLAGVVNAQADTQTYMFKDVLRPQGHERSAAVRHADGRACGVSANLDMPNNLPAFERCMAARGWRFDHVATTPSPSERPVSVPGGLNGVYTYNDAAPGPARGESEEQAATLVCDGGVSPRIGAASFNACMAARGWRLAAFEPHPAPEPESPADDAPSPPIDFSGLDAGIQAANDANAMTAVNAAVQSQAAAAAAQQ